MQTNNKLREALQLAKATFETLIKFQGDEGFVRTWAELGRDAMLAALAAPATAEKTSAVGDRAKLREVLEHIVNERDILDFCHNNLGSKTWKDWDKVYMTLRKWIDEAISALAAPPRNCDKYATADEALKAQEQMFNDSNFANGEYKLGCPECDNPRVGCKIAWLFATATEKEGGAK